MIFPFLKIAFSRAFDILKMYDPEATASFYQINAYGRVFANNVTSSPEITRFSKGGPKALLAFEVKFGIIHCEHPLRTFNGNRGKYWENWH